jgi:putative oxidoreductase
VLGAAFVVSGVRMIFTLGMVVGFLATKRVPAPAFVAGSGIAIEIVLGLLVIAGISLPAACVALAVFVVAATIMAHDFWNQEGMARAQDENAVISNAIIVGALLAIAGLAA